MYCLDFLYLSHRFLVLTIEPFMHLPSNFLLTLKKLLFLLNRIPIFKDSLAKSVLFVENKPFI